jgi:hypothetical protein
MPELPAPAVLHVFPLTGSLLPGNYLLLNIFEPRYRNGLQGPGFWGRLHADYLSTFSLKRRKNTRHQRLMRK